MSNPRQVMSCLPVLHFWKKDIFVWIR
jgi:hypothetical protein